ncbi:MAG: glutamate--tRNA ligase [Termitinemataceae bacterium]|nr:MAG: glutamate--tRNA ligase [Termitinemataceae bacterium]
MTQIRDRYAPSPTGLQHIGGLRTALFNYLFAKSQNGKFILRLEDTDRTRFDESYVQNLFDTFDWLQFKWDEGPDCGGSFAPYIQSERTGLYKKYAQQLLDSGNAYYCFCTTERIDAVRKERELARSSETGYDRFCRNIDVAEAAERAKNEPYTIRLKIPLGQTTKFTDKLLGEIEWKNDDVNPDPVLLKSDGFPTYHLANVVDDHLMQITHVLRAQEWLASTPLHVIMYNALAWTPPVFCHLPMVMGQDGKKLSKRHGATSIDEFRKNGYLPAALLNYVALLGASYKDGQDIYTLQELCDSFNIDKLNKSPAVFDYQKLQWYNGMYIRAMNDEDLAGATLSFAIECGLFDASNASTSTAGGAEKTFVQQTFVGRGAVPPTEAQKKLYVSAMSLVKERAVFLTEIPQKLGYLFTRPPVAAKEEFVPKKSTIETAVQLLKIGRGMIEAMVLSDDAGAEQIAKDTALRENVKLGDLLMPLRVAITGSRVSPPLFGSLRLLGSTECLARVDECLLYVIRVI